MTALVTERTITCRSGVCDIWGVLTDTERLNRSMGMNRIALRPFEDASAARYLVTTNLGGFSVEYEERPYEWVFPERFEILRKMRTGPITSLRVTWRLAPAEDGGSRVTVRVAIEPRVRLL